MGEQRILDDTLKVMTEQTGLTVASALSSGRPCEDKINEKGLDLILTQEVFLPRGNSLPVPSSSSFRGGQ
jgi:hypothetical protein